MRVKQHKIIYALSVNDVCVRICIDPIFGCMQNLSKAITNMSIIGFGGAGAGAPMRSGSGKVVTSLQGHPEIRFHQKDTRGFDQVIRYQMEKDKIMQYKQDLDKQLEEKQKWRQQLGSLPLFQPIVGTRDQQNYSTTVGPVAGSEQQRRRETGIELAPIMQMRKYKSLPKLNNLSSTDVTSTCVM